MARAISVDPIGLYNFSFGEDNFCSLHDHTKTDKEGQNLVQKHVCANPFDSIICPNTALGIWLALNQKSFEKSERVFRKETGGRGSASGRHSKSLIELFKQFVASVSLHVEQGGAHGIRKGAATSVSSGTTKQA